MSKRANHDGSVYFRKDRQRWVAALMIEKRRYMTYHRTEDEAKQALALLQSDHLENGHRHRWVLGAQIVGTEGRCKLCGAERLFRDTAAVLA